VTRCDLCRELATLVVVIEILQVSTTADSCDVALDLARSAVEARLAAGAQVYGPVTSVFWHAGEFGTGEEWQVVLKTVRERYPDLEAHLLARHPWDNPEVTALPLAAGSAGYLEWVQRTTAAPGEA
jgi:periplasmic divalent cation tolerance protein